MPRPRRRATKLICTFGRFNPPTRGHERLISAMLDAANATDDVVVYISPTTGDKNNPLTHEERRRIIVSQFPTLDVGASSVRTPYEMLAAAERQKYEDVTIFVGSDRTKEFEAIADTWNAANRGEMLVRVKGLRRNPNENDAGSAREAAVAGDVKTFTRIAMASTEIAPTMRRIAQRIKPSLRELHTTMKTFQQWLVEADERPTPPPSTQSGMGGPADGEAPADDPLTDDGGEDTMTPPTPEPPQAFNTTTDDGRVASDTPNHQVKMVLHPQQQLKTRMRRNYAALQSQRT